MSEADRARLLALGQRPVRVPESGLVLTDMLAGILGAGVGDLVDMVVVGLLRDEWLARREVLHDQLDRHPVLRFSGPGNERYDWPRGAMADSLVADLTARRRRREASGCARIA